VFWHYYKLTKAFDTCSISTNILVAMASGLLGDRCALPQTRSSSSVVFFKWQQPVILQRTREFVGPAFQILINACPEEALP
jgi:hypothetical protein